MEISKKLLVYLFLLPILLFQNQCYLLYQGCGQFDILRRRRSIQKVIRDPKTSDFVKSKLIFVEEVRKFAKDRMKLKVRSTYKSISELDRDYLAVNVIASEKLAFRSKKWSFPIVGSVPYLGFFNRSHAEKAAEKLKKKGWDVRMQYVSAYSTLGWFNDPLISTQLSLSEWYLASLLIHECTHATLWFKGDVSFNESLASFVGRKGALQFYAEKFGKDSRMYRQRLKILANHKKRTLLYHKYANQLNQIYISSLSDTEKLKNKKRLLRELEKILVKQKFRKISQTTEERLNNADLTSYLRYNSKKFNFQSYFQKCEREWECFFRVIREEKKNLGLRTTSFSREGGPRLL